MKMSFDEKRNYFKEKFCQNWDSRNIFHCLAGMKVLLRTTENQTKISSESVNITLLLLEHRTLAINRILERGYITAYATSDMPISLPRKAYEDITRKIETLGNELLEFAKTCASLEKHWLEAFGVKHMKPLSNFLELLHQGVSFSVTEMLRLISSCHAIMLLVLDKEYSGKEA